MDLHRFWCFRNVLPHLFSAIVQKKSWERKRGCNKIPTFLPFSDNSHQCLESFFMWRKTEINVKNLASKDWHGKKVTIYSPIFYLVKSSEMVFCYQNCSDLLWEKIVLVIKKKIWNSRLKAENFQKFWDHLNNLFKQWMDRTIFGNRMLFKLVIPFFFKS